MGDIIVIGTIQVPGVSDAAFSTRFPGEISATTSGANFTGVVKKKMS